MEPTGVRVGAVTLRVGTMEVRDVVVVVAVRVMQGTTALVHSLGVRVLVT